MATQQQIQQMQHLLDNLNRAISVQAAGSYQNQIDGTAHSLTAGEVTAIGTFITNTISAIVTLAGQF